MFSIFRLKNILRTFLIFRNLPLPPQKFNNQSQVFIQIFSKFLTFWFRKHLLFYQIRLIVSPHDFIAALIEDKLAYLILINKNHLNWAHFIWITLFIACQYNHGLNFPTNYWILMVFKELFPNLLILTVTLDLNICKHLNFPLKKCKYCPNAISN